MLDILHPNISNNNKNNININLSEEKIKINIRGKNKNFLPKWVKFYLLFYLLSQIPVHQMKTMMFCG